MRQNKVWVSVGGFTRFVNMTDWIKKVKRSIITERINDKTAKVSQSISNQGLRSPAKLLVCSARD